MELYESIFVRPWPFWVAGLCLGGFVPFFAWASGKALGISSGYAEMCSIAAPPGKERWKLWFALGLPFGGVLANVASGGSHAAIDWRAMDAAHDLGLWPELALLALGGALIGWGARTAGGCTSGHSIVGIALGAKSSLAATVAFMVGGFATAALLRFVLGGA